MTDLPPEPGFNGDTGDPGDDTGVRSVRGSPPGAPRWVKVFGIIVIVLALLFVTLHLTGGGFGALHRK